MKVEGKGITSFRQWNPERLDVPWGRDNGSDTEVSQSCCAPCRCVEKCFKTVFQEVIHEMKPGNITLKDMIKGLYDNNMMISKFIRVGAWLMMVVGNILLFAPVIWALKWIPMVGWLLGGVVSIAVGIFALIIGTILHLLTMATAWIFYRPKYGIALLVAILALVAMMFTVGDPFVFPW